MTESLTCAGIRYWPLCIRATDSSLSIPVVLDRYFLPGIKTTVSWRIIITLPTWYVLPPDGRYLPQRL